jgi:hypothetical protein
VLLKPQHFRRWFYFQCQVKGQKPNLLGLFNELISNLDHFIFFSYSQTWTILNKGPNRLDFCFSFIWKQKYNQPLKCCGFNNTKTVDVICILYTGVTVLSATFKLGMLHFARIKAKFPLTANNWTRLVYYNVGNGLKYRCSSSTHQLTYSFSNTSIYCRKTITHTVTIQHYGYTHVTLL